MKISVIGLGKLGSPTAACFASKGFHVIGVDSDEVKVADINSRKAPVSETGLQDLLNEPGMYLSATTDLDLAVRETDITFVIVSTPSVESGRFSLDYVLPVCAKIGEALRDKNKFHVVVITSTVMPGDCDGAIKETLESASGKVCGEQFGLCYNPEFIALGSVIYNFLHPDFVLLGANDPLSYARVAQIYESCIDSPVIKSMSRINAELTKISLNSYITTKISFANMLGRICEKFEGADVDVVTDAIGADSRIGKKYLKAGVSYGGPCFPRDNRALATLAPEFAGIPQATDEFNRSQIKWLADFVLSRSAAGDIAVLGKSYKPATDVTEESAGLLLEQEIIKRHGECFSWKETGTVVICQPCPEFANLNFSGKTVIDCWRFLPHLKDCPDVDYVPLGLG